MTVAGSISTVGSRTSRRARARCSVSPTMRIAIRSHARFGGATRWSSRTRSRRSTVALRWCVPGAEWDAHPQGRALAPLGRSSSRRWLDGEPRAAGRRRSPAGRCACARSDPGARGTDRRAHARRARCRSAPGQLAEAPERRRLRHRHEPRQAIDASSTSTSPRTRRDSGRWRRARTCSCRATGRARSRAAASAPRTSPRRTRGSCTSTSLAMATRVRGRRVRVGADGGVRDRDRGGTRRRRPPAPRPRRAVRLHHRVPRRAGRDGRVATARGRRGELPSVGLVVSDGYVDPIAGRRPRSRSPRRASATGEARLQETETGFGRLRHLRPVAEMSRTPPHWALPPAPIGTHGAAWSDG